MSLLPKATKLNQLLIIQRSDKAAMESSLREVFSAGPDEGKVEDLTRAYNKISERVRNRQGDIDDLIAVDLGPDL